MPAPPAAAAATPVMLTSSRCDGRCQPCEASGDVLHVDDERAHTAPLRSVPPTARGCFRAARGGRAFSVRTGSPPTVRR